jgi:hypothetical protein
VGTRTPSMNAPVFDGGAPRTKRYGKPLAIGVVPGNASMARSGSPNAPGTARASLASMADAPGAVFAPWTTTSSPEPGSAVVVSAPALRGPRLDARTRTAPTHRGARRERHNVMCARAMRRIKHSVDG